jgi:hypothetical protein
MARFAVGVVFGMLVGGLAGAAAGLHADEALGSEIDAAADQAGVDPTDLRGATGTTGLPPYAYLESVGELPAFLQVRPPPPPRNAALERRLDCIQAYESRGFPNAYNRSSGAAGLFQFLASTWRSTPQGRAGLSVFDPQAARGAARWMLNQGRAREWVPVQRGLC